jgi:maleate isomerase
LVTAFEALGAHEVALATPYEPRLNEKLVQYVEHFGFEVVNRAGLGLTLDWDIGTLGPAELNELVHRADTAEAEALFVSDTGIVLSPIAQALEGDLGKPVFSANMASMWHVLRLAGVHETQPELGTLFQSPLP